MPYLIMGYAQGTGAAPQYTTLFDPEVAGITLSNGNLTVNTTGVAYTVRSEALVTSGKVYIESTNNDGYFCVSALDADETGSISADPRAIGWWGPGGRVYTSGTFVSGASFGTGDVLGMALDMDAGVIYFYKNNVLEYTITMGSGGFPDLTDTGVYVGFNSGVTSAKQATFDFGQNGFTYTPPVGYVAITP